MDKECALVWFKVFDVTVMFLEEEQPIKDKVNAELVSWWSSG